MVLLYPLRIPYSRNFRFKTKDGHWAAICNLRFYQSGRIACVHWYLNRATYFPLARPASVTSGTYRPKRLLPFHLSSFNYILAFHRHCMNDSPLWFRIGRSKHVVGMVRTGRSKDEAGMEGRAVSNSDEYSERLGPCCNLSSLAYRDGMGPL